ncbi:MAG TPA: hypothetical protein VG675_25705 [Bryobacteraceae bacterium]|nr:hypothetical protein [Bryobacteraceae bacterium]
MILTDEVIDQLAVEGLNVVGAARGIHTYNYDITGYRRVPRLDTPFGKFHTWDAGSAPVRSPGAHPECALDRPYAIRLGGFERGVIYAPDRIGSMLREHEVIFSDGPGNGKYESAMLARKYGLRLVFEASAYGVQMPFTKKQLAAFEPVWEAQVVYMRDCCKRLGEAVGIDLVDDPDNVWVSLIGVDVQPLDLFLEHARRNYEEVNDDFRQEYGFDLPLAEASHEPHSVSRRIRFWEYVRRRYSELALLQNTVLRRHVRGEIVGNLEFDTEPDYTLWGQAYDVPGFNLRTALFDDEIGYRYWVGYGTKVSADLTHRAPMISVRTNQVAAGPRIIPTPETTRYWYSQAIQSGAGGFYLWIKDFYGDQLDPNGYAGPCMTNPDSSTRPKERWQTHLDASKILGRRRVFQPPASETGILVSIPSCAAGGWPDVFSAYVETARAGIFPRFVSSAELRTSDAPLSGLRLLLVPRALYEHRAVVRRLHDAAAAGLTVVIGDAESFSYDENGVANDELIRLTSVESGATRSSLESITVRQSGKEFRVDPYRAGHILTPLPCGDVAARYAGGGAAVVEHKIGSGRVISCGAPILDIYATGIRQLSAEKPARYELLRHWRETSGARDDSWVFDVTLDNLADVTGTTGSALRPPDPSVQFAPFLYVHGIDETQEP